VRTAYRLLAQHRDYRLVMLAGLVSLSGDWLLQVGLAYLVYDLTGSTLASGVALVAAVGPQLLLGSFAGVLADRWDRRRTMIASDLLQAVGLLPLLAVGEDRIWIVYAVALWQGVVSQPFLPAERALVPELVPADDLLSANALNGQNNSVARLVGSFAGGVVAAWGGLATLALVDAATFVVSAALVAAVRARPAPRDPDAERPKMLADWRAGLAVVKASPGLRLVFVVLLITGVGEGILATLAAPWVRDVAHGDGRWYGVIIGAQAFGGIAGGLAATAAGRWGSPARVAGWGALALGLGDLVLLTYPVAYPHPWPAVPIIALLGLPAALAMAGLITFIQTLTEDQFRGRVMGAIGTVEAVAVLAGIGIAATLGDVVGILPVIVLQGVGYVIAGALVLLTLTRRSPT
jgi:Na+/melibiose symporter-like transporter